MNIDTNFKIEIDKNILDTYSTDASIFKIMPSGVAKIGSVEQVKYLIENKIKFSLRGAGTCMSGGSLTEEMLIDTLNLDKIISQDEHSITTQPGIMTRDLLTYLEKSGQIFAPYTSSKNLCSIGGMLGNNSSGEKSLMYGPTSKNVLELKILLADNNIYHAREKEIGRENNFEKEILKLIIDNQEIIKNNKPNTHKNAAGYNIWDLLDFEKKTFNLTPLFIGAQGTLGFITEAKLKTIKIQKHNNMMVVPLEHIHDLPYVVQTMLNYKPTSVECFDNETYDLAKIHMAKDAEHAILCKNKKIIVFVEFCSDDVEENISKLKSLQSEMHAATINSYILENEEERNAYWNIRRASFGLLRDFAPSGYKAIPIIEDTIVSIEHYDNYLKELLEIIYKYDMRYTYAGHIGDGSIRLIPLVKIGKSQDENNMIKENILKMAEEVYALVQKYKGSISCDHNDGLARSYTLGTQYTPEILEIFKKIKNILDPDNIFNPGKKVYAESRNYVKSKINI